MLIKINGITPTESREGKTYWKLQTNKGDMSAFDQIVVDGLYEAWRANKEIEVDVKASADEKYVNIRGLGAGKELDEVRKRNQHFEGAHYQKPQDSGKDKFDVDKFIGKYAPISMYVSYAKDIFIGLGIGWNPNIDDKESKRAMNDCINLVKQAHEGFS